MPVKIVRKRVRERERVRLKGKHGVDVEMGFRGRKKMKDIEV